MCSACLKASKLVLWEHRGEERRGERSEVALATTAAALPLPAGAAAVAPAAASRAEAASFGASSSRLKPRRKEGKKGKKEEKMEASRLLTLGSLLLALATAVSAGWLGHTLAHPYVTALYTQQYSASTGVPSDRALCPWHAATGPDSGCRRGSAEGSTLTH